MHFKFLLHKPRSRNDCFRLQMSCRTLQKTWHLCQTLKIDGTNIGHLTGKSSGGRVQRWENPECVWRIARTRIQMEHALQMSPGKQLPWTARQDCGPRQTAEAPSKRPAGPSHCVHLPLPPSLQGPQHPHHPLPELSPTLPYALIWPSLPSTSS